MKKETFCQKQHVQKRKKDKEWGGRMKKHVNMSKKHTFNLSKPLRLEKPLKRFIFLFRGTSKNGKVVIKWKIIPLETSYKAVTHYPHQGKCVSNLRFIPNCTNYTKKNS